MSDAATNQGLTEFVCKDTGITLRIRHIPFTVTDRFFKQYEADHPAPKPPTNEVDYGDNEKVKEPNLADPTYLRRLGRYEKERGEVVNEQAKRLFTQLAVECEVDAAAVTALRAAMTQLGVELDVDDKFVYVWQIAVGTMEGHNELMSAIQRRLQPTEEGIAEARQSFRGQVQGS